MVAHCFDDTNHLPLQKSPTHQENYAFEYLHDKQRIQLDSNEVIRVVASPGHTSVSLPVVFVEIHVGFVPGSYEHCSGAQ
jgi:hypothetical protein